MNASDKLKLFEGIAVNLQQRYTFADLNDYFGAWLPPDKLPSTTEYNSKRSFAKDVLKTLPLHDVLKMAEELGVSAPSSVAAGGRPPRNWHATTQLRLFISHISKDKDKATRLKDCLSPYAISGFVAHEDIHPTLEWQQEIERALFTMDAFVAIHTVGFSQSVWTQQEIGFAVGRGTKIISLKMGEDPTGFISKNQALPRRQRRAEDIAAEIDVILTEDDRTSSKLAEAKRVSGGVDV